MGRVMIGTVALWECGLVTGITGTGLPLTLVINRYGRTDTGRLHRHREAVKKYHACMLLPCVVTSSQGTE